MGVTVDEGDWVGDLVGDGDLVAGDLVGDGVRDRVGEGEGVGRGSQVQVMSFQYKRGLVHAACVAVLAQLHWQVAELKV